MLTAVWEAGGFDGAAIQEIAEEFGLLKSVTATESCGEHCACAEHGFPLTCYRKTYATPATHGDGWINAENQLPENYVPVQVNIESTYRYKKYSPKSMQHRMGITGRWQKFNGYGWDNCEEPNQWKPQPEQEAV